MEDQAAACRLKTKMASTGGWLLPCGRRWINTVLVLARLSLSVSLSCPPRAHLYPIAIESGRRSLRDHCPHAHPGPAKRSFLARRRLCPADSRITTRSISLAHLHARAHTHTHIQITKHTDAFSRLFFYYPPCLSPASPPPQVLFFG